MEESNQSKLHFATNLKLLRKMKGLTQQALADALGIKRTAISTYEAGFTEPRLLMLQKMAQYFEVSIDHLIASAPESIGLDQILPEDNAINHDVFFGQLREFLNATTETQKIFEGLLEFDKLVENSIDRHQENYEASRLKLILKDILKSNWEVLKEIQMIE